MTGEDIARYVCTAGVLVSGAGLALSMPWAVPPALVWGVLLVVSGLCSWRLWLNYFEERTNDRERERLRPDRPYRQSPDTPYQSSTKDEPKY